MAAIHLRLEVEVRRQPLSRRRVNAVLGVADDQARRGRPATLVGDVQRDVGRGNDAEEHRRIVAEADVLRALSDVSGKRRLAPPGISAVELQDSILDRESRQRRYERRFVEELQIEPAVGDVARRDRLLRTRTHTEAARPAREDAHRLRARQAQRRGDPGLVANFDQERAPALLHELRGCLSLRDVHAALGIDVHVEQTMTIEHVLDACGGCPLVTAGGSGVYRPAVRLGQRRAEVLQCLDEARDLSCERLQLDDHRR